MDPIQHPKTYHSAIEQKEHRAQQYDKKPPSPRKELKQSPSLSSQNDASHKLKTEKVARVDKTIQHKGEFYFSEPKQEKGFYYFDYNTGATEASNTIREHITRTNASQLMEEYPQYIKPFESNALSKRLHECHKYALATLLGYKEMPSWISSMQFLRSFQCEEYCQSTPRPKENDLVIYYRGGSDSPLHFGFMGPNQNVISKWGTGDSQSYEHPPFFTSTEYSTKIIVWTPKSGTTWQSIREGIEKEYLHAELNIYNRNHNSTEDPELILQSVSKILGSEMEIDDILGIAIAARKIPADRRHQVIDCVWALTHSKDISRIDLIIDAMAKIQDAQRLSVIQNALSSFLRAQASAFFTAVDNKAQDFFSGIDIEKIIQTLNDKSIPASAIPELAKASSMLIRSRTSAEDICHSIQALQNCSRLYNIAPAAIAEATKPFVMQDVRDHIHRPDYLFDSVCQAITSGKADRIASFVLQLGESLPSYNTSYLADKLKDYIR